MRSLRLSSARRCATAPPTQRGRRRRLHRPQPFRLLRPFRGWHSGSRHHPGARHVTSLPWVSAPGPAGPPIRPLIVVLAYRGPSPRSASAWPVWRAPCGRSASAAATGSVLGSGERPHARDPHGRLVGRCGDQPGEHPLERQRDAYCSTTATRRAIVDDAFLPLVSELQRRARLARNGDPRRRRRRRRGGGNRRLRGPGRWHGPVPDARRRGSDRSA